MPIPWAAAAKVIPWGEVIAAAPGIVRSARELLTRTTGAEGDRADGDSPEQRIAALERQVQKIDDELTASSDLITRLAEQNERLIAAVDTLHRQLAIVSVVAGVALLGTIAALLLP
ncbi:MAG: hypothetical protein KDH15_19950 [Rhodocyclaceae bacterium]|nr:hypothetical protein [Rhodocyclaceae bacterium]